MVESTDLLTSRRTSKGIYFDFHQDMLRNFKIHHLNITIRDVWRNKVFHFLKHMREKNGEHIINFMKSPLCNPFLFSGSSMAFSLSLEKDKFRLPEEFSFI